MPRTKQNNGLPDLALHEFTETQTSRNHHIAHDLHKKVMHTELDDADHSGMLYSVIDMVPTKH